jgi:hypothetical protein
LPTKAPENSDDGRIVPEKPVTVQLLWILDQFGNVVERVGARRMSRELNTVPRGQAGHSPTSCRMVSPANGTSEDPASVRMSEANTARIR